MEKEVFFGNGSHFKAVLKHLLEIVKSSFKEKMEKLCKHYVVVFWLRKQSLYSLLGGAGGAARPPARTPTPAAVRQRGV